MENPRLLSLHKVEAHINIFLLVLQEFTCPE